MSSDDDASVWGEGDTSRVGSHIIRRQTAGKKQNQIKKKENYNVRAISEGGTCLVKVGHDTGFVEGGVMATGCNGEVT